MSEQPPRARILVIRFSSIGDIVLTTPVVRALATQLYGGAEVHFLTKKAYAPVLEGNPYIHRVHTIEKATQEVMPELKEIGFDYIIDLHRNVRSYFVKRGLKRLAFTFEKRNFQKWWWVNTGVNRIPAGEHVVDRYMATLRAFSVSDDGKGLDFFIPEGKGFGRPLPNGWEQGFVAFSLGATHIGKRMDKEKIAEICRSIQHPVALLGGPTDRDTGAWIEAQCPNTWNAAGDLTIHESADLLRRARVVVSGDTGLMHIAAAFGQRIVSVWGCTVPGLGMGPYRPHPSSVIIEPAGRKKRPCSKLGDRCKYGDPRCIQAVEDTAVVQAVHLLWEESLHGKG